LHAQIYTSQAKGKEDVFAPFSVLPVLSNNFGA